ncbi:MAG: N-acyl-D-aspartate/D-glutamate deacylase, partial [Ilumatobacter sp.]
MAEFDLVIRGGELIDGTGTAARVADVAVRDGIVVEVGAVSGSGTEEIDADGALVIPGIVDIHAHYDGQATWEERMQPSSWHGVTTVVMGNCGVGFAPVADADHNKLIELMEGVEDIPGAALHEGLAWNWNSFGEFLDAVDARPHDIDVAAQVPHGALRLNVMGERGANHEDATPDDIAAMAELAREGIEAGALGFTTSRTRNHKTSTGAYTPTLTAAPDELIGIAEGVGAAGTGVLQVVSDFLDVDDEFATLRSMVARSGRPMSISVARNPMVPDAFRSILDHITSANAAGLTMTGQVAARAVGLILGLELTLHPFLTNSVYAEIADLPLADRVAALRTPTFRERLLARHRERQAERNRDKLGGSLISKFDLLFEMADEPDYEPSLNDSIAARARRDGVTPEELALDVVLSNDGRGMLYFPFLNYVDGNLDGVREMLVHPHTVPGLGDGGAHVGTICDGSFPTTLLQYWGRDRERGTIDLPFLV